MSRCVFYWFYSAVVAPGFTTKMGRKMRGKMNVRIYEERVLCLKRKDGGSPTYTQHILSLSLCQFVSIVYIVRS